MNNLSNEFVQVIGFGFFILAIIFVFLVVWTIYTLFKRFNIYNNNVVLEPDNGEAIVETKLRRFSTFNSIYLVDMKLIAKPELDNYTMVIKYDWNNLGITLGLYKEDLLKEQNRINQIVASTPTPFDQVVKILDNFESSGSGNKTQGGDLSDWRDNTMIQNVSTNTSTLFNLPIGNTGQSNNVDNMIPQVSQGDIDHIFSVLDRMRVDMDMKDVVDFEVENRKMILQLPIKVIDRNDDSVLMRFDPADLKNTFDTDILRSFDLRVYNDKMVLSPIDIPDRQFIIPLK